MKVAILLSLGMILYSTVYSSEILTSGVSWYLEGPDSDKKSYAVLDIHWKNSWNNLKNHDGAWVFLKFYREGTFARAALLKKEGVKVIHQYMDRPGKFTCRVSDDQLGFFIYPSAPFRGVVKLKLSVDLDVSRSGNIPSTGTRLEAHALEMVYIPAGRHFIGEPDTALARQFHTFYQADAEGRPAGVFQVIQENQEIPIGPASLYYHAAEIQYQGDMKGVLTPEFPKGVAGFYCMKYELNQGQYADFLNALNPGQTTVRANFGGSLYYKQRGTIYHDGQRYQAASRYRPCNFLSWDDAMAYADWAGLRPMTELEFSKSARGPIQPKARAFPWGTADKLSVQRRVDESGDLKFQAGLDESQLNDSTLVLFGASYYWVMDLAGSLWERVITVGDEKGRGYTGRHGDGQLNYYGNANVPGWPQGNEETGGFGFCGGGFYTHDRAYGDFLPFSPVSYRRYGAWSGGARVEAYGSSFVRTE
jgi:formylglycine-generating enzyme required for sulfatase activity